MSRERAINAEEPLLEREARPGSGGGAGDPPGAEPLPTPPTSPGEEPDASAHPPAPAPVAPPPTATAPASPPRRRRRQPIPAPLKLIGGLVAAAVALLAVVVAIGRGENDGEPTVQGPAPAPREAAREASTASHEVAAELGFPAFATANTTRIGGSDPVANAAAAALAVFPSTTPAQRPAAVALVDGGDWQGALAAAVLTAAPVRAPILISGDGSVPGPTEDALAALAPRGSRASGGAAIFAVGAAAVPQGAGQGVRLKGTGPAAAARLAALRDRLFGEAPRHIVVAPSSQPAFAMPGAAWSARSGDPLLFTGPAKLAPETAAALRRHPRVPVYVLGPSSAIPSQVLREIDAAGGSAHRVSGEDPVANAIAFARYADGSFGWNVNDPGHGFVLARSDSTLDAAAAAPLSAAGTWGPLLLTDSAATLPPALRDYLLDVKPGYTTDPTRAFYNHVWLIGDPAAIELGQQAEVNELAELAKIGAGSE